MTMMRFYRYAFPGYIVTLLTPVACVLVVNAVTTCCIFRDELLLAHWLLAWSQLAAGQRQSERCSVSTPRFIRLTHTPGANASHLIIDIKLDIFGKRAYVSPGAAIVVDHRGDRRVVQGLRDPLQLHRRHVVFLFPQTSSSAASSSSTSDSSLPVCQ